MKILLIGINARYSHQNLAVHYIKNYINSDDVFIREFNINQVYDSIYEEILNEKADVIGFSSYIWNMEMIKKIASMLKKANPHTMIVLGGPEVSFDSREIMEENEYIDVIIRGEGEEASKKLFEKLIGEGDFSDISGITYREGEKIIENPDRELIENLDTIPSPFKGLKSAKNKMLYYEMSRGCPFKCSYCLSSTIKGVRYFSEDRIKSDLIDIINSGADTVKLVDRTFNANEKFSMEIMDFIYKHAREGMCFHMELTAHLISDEFLEFLKKFPKGLFQFEIGIQSANEKTLDAIHRVTDLERLGEVVRTIKSYGNIHQHVDLIAGLPYEDYESFKESFNYAYSLGAEKLQLGFLKLLRGSELRNRASEFGIVYEDGPTYEVIRTKDINPYELRRLKIIEDLVDKYANENYFKWILEYLIDETNPFEFFEKFSYFWEQKGYHLENHSRKSLYQKLYEYLKDRDDLENLMEVLRLDFLLNQNMSPEKYMNPQSVDLKLYHEILKDKEIRRVFEISDEIPTKKLIRDFRFEKFGFGGQSRIFGFYYGKVGTIRVDITEIYERIIDGLY